MFYKGLNRFQIEFFSIEWEKLFFWFFFVDCLLLGFIGSQPIEYPYLGSGRMFTILYFIYFILLFFLNKNLIFDEETKKFKLPIIEK